MKKNLNGKEYWRSLDQLANTPQYRKFLENEFPPEDDSSKNGLSRRKFLALMGASMSLAGLTACRKPVEKIIPYVTAPEEIIPGIPRYFASTMPFGTNAYGIIVESHDGRPTKIDGNTKHPSSLGGSNALTQAAILNLYDPDRSQRPRFNNKESDWNNFIAWWQGKREELVNNQGEGFAVLSSSFSSPTLSRLKKAFLNQFPKAQWFAYEPVSDQNIRKGTELASGKLAEPRFHFNKARIILSIDSDFALAETDNIVNARKFMDGRRVKSEKDEMNRLYAVESAFTITGGMADHVKRIPASQISGFVLSLIKYLKDKGLDIPGTYNLDVPAEFEFNQKWLDVLSQDLLDNKGQSLIIAGRRQPKEVHALVFALNEALNNLGQSVSYPDPVDKTFDSSEEIVQLADLLNGSKIKNLLILGGNPVYNAPAELNFEKALQKAEFVIHASELVNQTAHQATWHLPSAHFLEAWGDARALDGTLSIVQPLIAPLFKGKSDIEILSLITSGEEKDGYAEVRKTWQNVLGQNDFEKKWRKVLHDGVLENSFSRSLRLATNKKRLNEYFTANTIFFGKPDKENFEIIFQASPTVYDGRYANNGWLQELPDSVTKLAWDNAALMSLKTAQYLKVKNEDMVVLEYDGRQIPLPVWIQPGQPEFCITVELGYGQKDTGRIANGVGFNTYEMRTSQKPDFDLGLYVRRIRDTYPLSTTQDHSSMEGRPIVREATLGEYKEHPEFAQEMVEHPPLVSLWEEHSYDEGYQWGMVIDLNSCTGCNACTIACQSENNIPIVGKEQVKEGREMHWLRMDRYYQGDTGDPEMVFQPVACQHCENAPCEQVCPVHATVHDSEGLNVMAYNRCIGTRYCSNNCPYKVRRFNFFNYTNQLPEIVKMAQNPDVTVRSRGVMEKCTYCTQRINYAKINAKNAGRTVKDGEIISACQQSCPTNAIVFGNLNDPASEVSRLKKQNRNYEMLAELNVQPRTSYLAKLRNPHPDLTES